MRKAGELEGSRKEILGPELLSGMKKELQELVELLSPPPSAL